MSMQTAPPAAAAAPAEPAATRCGWHDAAQLRAAEPQRMAVLEAYARADLGGDLCLDPADDGVPLGLAFGPLVNAPRLITRTAGSTGRPRRVIRTQASWTASFRVMATRFGITEGDRYGVLGDLSHSLSLYALAEGLHLGASVGLAGAQTPAGMGRWIAEDAPTVLYATPTQLRAVDLATDPALCFRQVRVLLAGGGPFDGAAAHAVFRRFPNARLELFYGTSETSFLTLGAARDDAALDIFPGVDLAIGGPQTPGEIWAGGPYIASGYAKGDAPATGRPRCDSAGRISLGERGTLLPDGRVRLLGRGADMVTVSDRNVFPAAIEAWLLSQAGIGHAAVLPRKDALRGHRLEAAICGGCRDIGWLQAELRRSFGPEATPVRIIMLENWPVLPSGKTDLSRVRAALEHP